MMWEDPIVKEVREIRDKIAAEHNYDVKALGRYLQEKQKQEKRLIVKRPPRYIDQDSATSRLA